MDTQPFLLVAAQTLGQTNESSVWKHGLRNCFGPPYQKRQSAPTTPAVTEKQSTGVSKESHAHSLAAAASLRAGRVAGRACVRPWRAVEERQPQRGCGSAGPPQGGGCVALRPLGQGQLPQKRVFFIEEGATKARARPLVRARARTWWAVSPCALDHTTWMGRRCG